MCYFVLFRNIEKFYKSCIYIDVKLIAKTYHIASEENKNNVWKKKNDQSSTEIVNVAIYVTHVVLMQYYYSNCVTLLENIDINRN